MVVYPASILQWSSSPGKGTVSSHQLTDALAKEGIEATNFF